MSGRVCWGGIHTAVEDTVVYVCTAEIIQGRGQIVNM